MIVIFSIDSDEVEDARPWDNLIRKLSIEKVGKLASIFKEIETNQGNGVSKDDFIANIDLLIGNFRLPIEK